MMVLKYATGAYEDYHEHILFEGEEKLIREKEAKIKEALDYLNERAQKFLLKHPNYWYESVLERYLKALGSPIGYLDGGLSIFSESVESFEGFLEKRDPRVAGWLTS